MLVQITFRSFGSWTEFCNHMIFLTPPTSLSLLRQMAGYCRSIFTGLYVLDLQANMLEISLTRKRCYHTILRIWFTYRNMRCSKCNICIATKLRRLFIPVALRFDGLYHNTTSGCFVRVSEASHISINWEVSNVKALKSGYRRDLVVKISRNKGTARKTWSEHVNGDKKRFGWSREDAKDHAL
jgi:hypothetical protein